MRQVRRRLPGSLDKVIVAAMLAALPPHGFPLRRRNERIGHTA